MRRWLALLLALALPIPSVADPIAPTTRCPPGRQLDSNEQFALGHFNRTYLMFLKSNGEPQEFTMNVTTPRAFLGDGFPNDVCGADVFLTLPDGTKMQGVLTYTAPDPKDEHRPYAFNVTFINQPDVRMSFDATFHGQINGYIAFPSGESYFVGADDWRWDD